MTEAEFVFLCAGLCAFGMLAWGFWMMWRCDFDKGKGPSL
jgi:hypothetical protein